VKDKPQGAVELAQQENITEFHALTREQARASGAGTGAARWSARLRFAAPRLSILLLSGFLCLGGVACMESTRNDMAAQASGADRPGAQRPRPQSETRRAPSPPRKEASAWRYFGERESTPPARPPATGVWHHFGSADNAAADARPAGNSTTSTRSADVAPAPAPSPRRAIARQPARASVSGDLAKQMFALLNRDRLNPANNAETGGRIQPLRWNNRLAAVARAYSLEMIRRGFFGHVDPEGRSVGDRLRAAGIDWQSVGENIAMDRSVADAENAFMDEPRFQRNHRANILDSGYTDVGIGVVLGPDGLYYITQEFMRGATAP
jgi:uncharacterized protein YkwD